MLQCCVETIPHLMKSSRQHSEKFCGMAEMNGPMDPSANPKSSIRDLEGCEGVIPLRWIVVKDVPFSAFNGVTHKGQPVTQLRRANT